MKLTLLIALAFCLLGSVVRAAEQDPATALNFKMKSLGGEEVNLADYSGKVVLVVNVASYCGNTPQYAALQSLYEKHGEEGLVVLGFPCNQFGQQEPGDSAKIAEFCKTKYSVTFPMFEKIEVKGEGAAPFYKFLTSRETNPKFAGDIPWNFEKFLIGRDGKVAARFAHREKPDSPAVLKTIEAELKK